MKKNPYVIVYGDGGGARGFIPLRILSHLRADRKSHFMEGVDFVGGPSTSAIYLSAFNRPSEEDPTKPYWSEEQMEENYRKCCPQIFHLNPITRHLVGKLAALPMPDNSNLQSAIRSMHKYNPAILERFMRQLLGDMKVGDGLRSQMIAVKDYKGENLRFSHVKEDSNCSAFTDVLASKAVTASCMHPLCYPSYGMEIDGKKYNFLDGGMFEHPYHVYCEMRDILPPDTDIHMIVLFSGRENGPTEGPERYNNLGITGLFHHSIKMPVISEFMSAVHKENMRHLRHALGDKLIELNYDLASYFPKGAPQVDVATDDVMKTYEKIADDAYEQQKDVILKMRNLFNVREEARYAPEPEPELETVTQQVIELPPEPTPAAAKKGWDLAALLPFLSHKNRPGSTSTIPETVHAPQAR